MRRIVLLALVVICALAIVHAFFMPWAKASTSVGRAARGVSGSSSETGKIASLIGGLFKGMGKESEKIIAAAESVEIKMSVSGYDIPKMMNTESSQIAVAIMGIFMKDAKDADKKSYAVYLMPIFGLACVGLAIMGMKKKVALIVMTVLSGCIAVGGLYKLMTTNLSNTAVTISIENGLWQTFYAYLLISVISIVWIVTDSLVGKKVKK